MIALFEMSVKLLLSSHAIFNIAISESEDLQCWLDGQNRKNEIVYSEFSILKAGGLFAEYRRSAMDTTGWSFSKFLQMKIPPSSVIGNRGMSEEIFHQLNSKQDGDQLDILAITLAIQNDYTYQCWDSKEVLLTSKISSAIKIASQNLNEI